MLSADVKKYPATAQVFNATVHFVMCHLTQLRSRMLVHSVTVSNTHVQQSEFTTQY